MALFEHLRSAVYARCMSTYIWRVRRSSVRVSCVRSASTFTDPQLPDFKNPEWLKQHFTSHIDFHQRHGIDPRGGYFQHLAASGSVVDDASRSIVSTTRGILLFGYAAQLYRKGWGNAEQADRACEACAHGLQFLEKYFKQREDKGGGYVWELQMSTDGNVTIMDDTRHCYGAAFVHAALASAHAAGVCNLQLLENSWTLLETNFWRTTDSLYVDEISGSDWTTVDDYRGANANMHMTEAMLVAYEATGDSKYLDRALLLARRLCVDLSPGEGLVWEHYDSKWQHDWNYNLANDPHHLFRPWGYLPGHLVEWSKLLMIINRHIVQRKWVTEYPRPPDKEWLVPTAKVLFKTAMQVSWDVSGGGGMFYTCDRNLKIFDDDKYMWPHAEAIGSAYLLAQHCSDTDEATFYMAWYDKVWAYSWRYLVDAPGAGRDTGGQAGWFGVLSNDNELKANLDYGGTGTLKSWFSDYHSQGAVYEVLRNMPH